MFLYQTYIILRKEASLHLSREENVTYFSLRILFSHGSVYHACKKCAVCRDVCHCLKKSKQRKVFGPNDRIIRLFSCAPTKAKLWQTAVAVCTMTFVYLTHSVKLTLHQTLCTIDVDMTLPKRTVFAFVGILKCILSIIHANRMRRRRFDIAEANCICIHLFFFSISRANWKHPSMKLLHIYYR